MEVARRKEHRAAAAAFLFAVVVLGVLACGARVRAFEDGTAVYIVEKFGILPWSEVGFGILPFRKLISVDCHYET